jgi:dTDP-4-dehydrorhamnose reductase
MKRILLLGSSGQLGYELVRTLGPLGHLLTPSREDIDLAVDGDDIVEKIIALKPDLVINAAAYTAVDKAETETTLAWQINAQAPAAMAKACHSLDIPLIHFSTDYVFDGQGNKPWTEVDKPHPINTYGETKLAGEDLIRQSQVKHLIFRTSWVYGSWGNNFLKTMMRLAQERESLTVVDDQIGAPTWSRHIAEAMTAVLVVAVRDGKSFWYQYGGTYHLTNAGLTSWHGFAAAIFAELSELEHAIPSLSAIDTENYPTAAARPRFSVLDNTLLGERFGLYLPDWRQTLSLVMQDLNR